MVSHLKNSPSTLISQGRRMEYPNIIESSTVAYTPSTSKNIIRRALQQVKLELLLLENVCLPSFLYPIEQPHPWSTANNHFLTLVSLPQSEHTKTIEVICENTEQFVYTQNVLKVRQAYTIKRWNILYTPDGLTLFQQFGIYVDESFLKKCGNHLF